MTQEDKQLLLKDLCARLPYGEICQFSMDGTTITEEIQLGGLGQFMAQRIDVKPYLRPMSSMTEEEKKELKETTCPEGTGYFDEQYLICPMSHFGECIGYDFMSDILDWLNAHHFDYRGLIEKGLALEAPEGMYKIEEL